MMITAVSVLEKKIVCKAVVAGMGEDKKNTEPVQVLFNVELRRGYIYLVYDRIVENIMDKIGWLAMVFSRASSIGKMDELVKNLDKENIGKN